MGAKTWMLVYAEDDARAALRARPALDRTATVALARTLFPNERLDPLDDGDLSATCPPDDEICIGVFPGVAVVAAKEFGIDRPSTLPAHFLAARPGREVVLHAMHSVVDWFAYARWIDGALVRALSLAPDSGILEEVGARPAFEQPYWAGAHPAVDADEEGDAYPFPFHPLELGEAVLRECFGYQLEGLVDDSLLAPHDVPLLRFRRAAASRSWWMFWR